jgi:hypothetical protein
MLRISRAQMREFQRLARLEFARRATVKLRAEFGQELESVDDEELLLKVNEGIEKADSYGIDDEYDVERFLRYAVMYGREFGVSVDTAWVGKILDDGRSSATTRMNRIDETFLFGERCQMEVCCER